VKRWRYNHPAFFIIIGFDMSEGWETTKTEQAFDSRHQCIAPRLDIVGSHRQELQVLVIGGHSRFDHSKCEPFWIGLRYFAEKLSQELIEVILESIRCPLRKQRSNVRVAKIFMGLFSL